MAKRALEERREHDLGLCAQHASVLTETFEKLLEMARVRGAHDQDGARLAGDRVRGDDLRVAFDSRSHLVGRAPPCSR